MVIMEVTLDSLAASIENVKALQECRNIMARYCFYHTAFRHREYVENCWAKRDDCTLMMPWGAYAGIEGVKRCYFIDHGDRSDPKTYESLKGAMFMHCLDTECLVVSDDGQTARGVWITPGHETFVDNGEAHGNWCWGKYCTDFIKENGQWKIWHMRLYPLFNTPYEECWTKQPVFDAKQFIGDEGTPPAENEVRMHPDMPVDMWSWSIDSVYPADQPEPPLPYRTFSDVAPGYGI